MALNCSTEINPIDTNTVSIKYIVGGWLTLAFCLFGIVTNIFTVIVLLHPRMRNSSTHVYLMAMSVCNIFLLAGLMVNYSLKSIATYPELLAYLRLPDEINRNALWANSYEQFYARVAPITTPLLSMFLLCSTYLTVLVSGDRYFLICWPLIAEKIRTRRMALYLVLLMVILVNIYILPHWFEYKTKQKIIRSLISNIANQSSIITNNNNDTKLLILAELGYTSLGSNKIYLSIYRFYLNIPVTFVIPFSLLAICNGSMIHKLVMIKQKKKRLGHRMKADIRITTMLIVIVLTFMLCRSLNLLVNLLVQLSPCLNKNSLQRFNTFANLLIAFNGFVNFFLFAAFGQRFREMVLYIFFRHGQHPFFGPLDGISGHRTGAGGTIQNTPESSRRQSRRFSANDSDLLAAISRRRSSATMAVLYHPPDVRPRSSSHSQTNSSPGQWSSRLHIPTFFHGGNQNHKKRTSNSSGNFTESPFLTSSYQQLPPGTINLSTTLHVPMTNKYKTPSPSCIKKKNTNETATLNGAPTTHHVKFV